jgi:beta-barrel assembly-enhancing protease
MGLSKSITDLRASTGGQGAGAYNATYTISGMAQPARLALLKNKAAIQLGAVDTVRTVYWLYHNITPPAAGVHLFTYTSYPPQTLEVLDEELVETLTARLHQSKKMVTTRRNRMVLGLFAAIISFFALLYFFFLPWLAAALAARVPVAYEKQLGDELFASLKHDYQIDDARSAYAAAFFDALQIPSNYPVHITVVKSEVANAFALPGGHIIIHDKLLNQLTAYPQLAALLAHEFVHIQNRHALKNLFRRASATLLFSTLIGDAGALGSAVLNSADNLKSLSYSRSLESEADADGLGLLTTRKIDGIGYVQLFQILKHEPQVEGPEWVSSHPQLQTRIRNIQHNKLYQQQQPAAHETLHQLFLKIKTAD